MKRRRRKRQQGFDIGAVGHDALYSHSGYIRNVYNRTRLLAASRCKLIADGCATAACCKLLQYRWLSSRAQR